MMFEFPAMDTLAYNTKQAKKSDLFWDTAPTRSAKFKHHKYSENVNFEETSNNVSILVLSSRIFKEWIQKLRMCFANFVYLILAMCAYIDTVLVSQKYNLD